MELENRGKTEDKPEDPIESSIGSFGKWQLGISLALALIKVPISWHQLAIVFLAPPVNFTCIDQTDRCDPECSGWDYDRSIFEDTIVMQWNLVCDRSQLANVAQTVFMFGVLVGSFIFGMAADKYGRKIPLMMAIILQTGTGVASAYVPLFTEFLVLRFLDAIATGGLTVIGFVICMELIGQKWRTTVSVLYHIPFNLGNFLLPVLSYFLRDWHHFQLAISTPLLLMLMYWWIVPESPRWLLTVGRRAEALEILERGAKANKLPKPELPVAKVRKTEAEEKSASVLDLFRTPNLRKRTLCIYFNWLVCGLCFFGLIEYVGQFGGNIFINVAISGVIELPGAMGCTYLMEKFGRRKTVMGANTLTGVACLLIMIVVNEDGYWPRVGLASLGIVGVSITFPSMYLYSGEIFPTVVRNVGIGTSSMCARIGSMVAPFVTSLAEQSQYLPPIFFGVIPLIGTFFTLYLPETAGSVLSNTIEEGEKFGKSKRTGITNKGFEGD